MRRFVANFLRSDPFAAAFAILAIVSGIRSLVDPDSLPIDQALEGLAPVWAMMFLLGGVALMIGCGTGRGNIEAAGCALFAGGILVEAMAFGFLLGLGQSWVPMLSLVTFGLFSLVRMRRLWKGQRLVWVRLEEVVT